MHADPRTGPRAQAALHVRPWVHIRLLQRSAHSALVELEHQRRADVVGERQHLLLTKHVLDVLFSNIFENI